MPEIIDHLASLTGLRDRDTLDVSLAHSIRDLLVTQSVAIYRLVGDIGQGHWMNRAFLTADSPAATSDPAWIDLSDLPAAADAPDRIECMETATVLVRPQEHGVLNLFPIISDTGPVGVVEITTLRPIVPKMQRLVFGLLRIYRNVQSLLDYSERDTLTGLLNRKIFDESFYKVSTLPQRRRGVADSERRQQDQAHYFLGVIDIDHFKLVNDRFGHLIGDEVLLLLSRIMRGCFRFSDQLYRFGGEEFVVLLLCSDEADAKAAFERLRRVVGEYPFPQAGKITVSVGFTAIDVGDTPAAAFERADRAVYFAKHNGRDQVRSHAELIQQGLIEDDKRVSDVELF